MEKMTQTELTQMLLRYAKSDMRIARREGDMSICQTKHGRLDVSYNSNAKTYTVTSSNGVINVTGAAKQIEVVIADAYDVVMN